MCATATSDPTVCRPGDAGYGPESPGYEPLELMPAADDADGWIAWLAAKHRAAGRPMCRRCDWMIDRKDPGGLLHGTWCSTCEANWLETEVLIPLIERLGRRRALSALLALARGK